MFRKDIPAAIAKLIQGAKDVNTDDLHEVLGQGAAKLSDMAVNAKDAVPGAAALASLPTLGVLGFNKYVSGLGNKLEGAANAWSEDFAKVPGLSRAGNKFSPGVTENGVLKTLNSGLSNLDVLGTAKTTDEAAKAYATGANRLLNTKLAPFLKVKHLLSVKHNLGPVVDDIKDGTFPKDKWGERLKTILKNPKKLLTEEGILSPGAAGDVAFNKEHYGLYGNSDVTNPKVLKHLATHQIKDVGGNADEAFRRVMEKHDINVPSVDMPYENVRKILTDNTKSFQEKAEAIRALNLPKKNGAAQLADAIIHGYAPPAKNQRSLGKYTSDILSGKGDTGKNHMLQGGATPYLEGYGHHSQEARQAARLIRNKILKKTKGAIAPVAALSGTGAGALLLNAALGGE